MPLLSFLEALNSAPEDGRVSVTVNAKSESDRELKFLLMNPGARFAKVVERAHAVLLAGGTMHPVDDVVRQLFPAHARDGVALFSCGHVVPKENVAVATAGRGPSGKRLALTFDARRDSAALDEVGACLLDLARVVPHGMVVFMPSYQFEAALAARWTETGLLNELGLLKPVVRETRSGGGASSSHESAWERYVSTVRSQGRRGAALFAVMGGKLSEGINFSDELARCVVVVGLPYANKADPELAARIAYLGDAAGARFYENQCWKTINQSVGRAIRHAKDFAAIVMLDARFCSSASKARLPGWLQQSLVGGGASAADEPTWGDVLAQLRGFFRSREEEGSVGA